MFELSAQPSRRPASSGSPRRPRVAQAEIFPPRPRAQGVDREARLERRRRVLHFRRRRRDLLEDSVAALVLMIVALIILPGLGVLAIIEVPVALALIGTVVAERRIRKRRLTAGRESRRPSRS